MKFNLSAGRIVIIPTRYILDKIKRNNGSKVNQSCNISRSSRGHRNGGRGREQKKGHTKGFSNLSEDGRKRDEWYCD